MPARTPSRKIAQIVALTGPRKPRKFRPAGHPCTDNKRYWEERMSLRFALLSAAFAAAMLGLAPAGANAAEHTVKMLNDNGKGEFMVFEPSFVEAAPGDTIKFVATDQFHNAETLPEIWPEGAARFKGELSKDVTLTVDKEGVYGIKCTPHYIMGMMALVVVGKPVNADQVKAFQPPEMGKKRFEALAAQVPQ
jgi:pseudoazurin